MYILKTSEKRGSDISIAMVCDAEKVARLDYIKVHPLTFYYMDAL